MSFQVAVVGLAGIGRRHLQVLGELPEALLVAVCDLNAELAGKTALGLGVEAYADPQAMLAAVDLDAVILATPPASHAPLTEAAAARGVHVFAEKPMAESLVGCRRMIDACERAGVTLMIGHKKRFLPAVQRLRELLEGELGPIRHLTHRYPHPWLSDRDWFWDDADGGGPQLENAVHAADLLRYLAGDVKRVYAEGAAHFATERAPQINDAVYTARFVSGAIGCVNAGMVSLPALNFEDLYVACDGGIAELSGAFDRAETLRYAFRGEPTRLHEETFAGADAFRIELQHFFDCLETGSTPLTSGPESLEAIRLCLAVKQSARLGLPVEVAEVV